MMVYLTECRRGSYIGHPQYFNIKTDDGIVGHDCYGVYTTFLMITYILEIIWMHIRLYMFRDSTLGAKSTIMGVSVEVKTN